MHPSACSPTFALGAVALLGACSGEAQPPVRATLLTSVSPAHCVQSLTSGSGTDPIRCPTPLREAVAEATNICKEVGGTLSGAPEGDVWAIDVNGDGRQELVFELNGNVACEGAYSVFSCGSLGCPKALYELRNGVWTVIGGISASAPEDLALRRDAASDGHRALEVCSQERCRERWIYEWLGTTYDATRLEVGGARVDIASSIHGLYPLAAATTVLPTPTANAAAGQQYDAGIDVAIIGTTEGGDYYYVSPCNACESGFVARAAVTIREN
jgi:hypothetical protein